LVDTDTMKKRLQERLDVLSKRTEKIQSDLRQPGEKDSQERATEAENDEVLEQLGEVEIAEIEQVRSALTRIEEGSYGSCISCGGPIRDGRLQVLPFATQCIGCAS
jgi:DnaK suppressor protein